MDIGARARALGQGPRGRSTSRRAAQDDDELRELVRTPTGAVGEPARRRRLHAHGVRDRRPGRRSGDQGADARSSTASATRSATSRTRAGSRGNIAGAQLRRAPGDGSHLSGSTADDILDEVQEFLTRRARAGRAGSRSRDDPVHRRRRFDGSSARARRPALARSARTSQRDRPSTTSSAFADVRSTRAGDGFFATFDGPARAIRCARSIVDERARRRARRARGPAHRRVRARAAIRFGESRSTRARVSPLAARRGGARVEHREGSRRRIRDRVHRRAACTSSRGFRASGGCTPQT